MPIEQRTELSPAETDEFIGQHETGVLSLAREDDPYAIPISYGYDAGERKAALSGRHDPGTSRRVRRRG